MSARQAVALFCDCLHSQNNATMLTRIIMRVNCIQNAYDAVLAQIKSDEELEWEKNVLKMLGYGYFRDNFNLPDLPRKLDEQDIKVRTSPEESGGYCLAQ
ncbi:MAG: hypothetical protein ACI36Y_09010 [Coriobacteriales bacterium]